jgi:hypothetical protein
MVNGIILLRYDAEFFESHSSLARDLPEEVARRYVPQPKLLCHPLAVG